MTDLDKAIWTFIKAGFNHNPTRVELELALRYFKWASPAVQSLIRRECPNTEEWKELKDA